MVRERGPARRDRRGRLPRRRRGRRPHAHAAGGENAFGENRGDLRAFARVAIRAGADLVLGSGPHVLRGLELYRGRLIAYSLGNLAGWHNFATRGPVLSLSALIKVQMGPHGPLPRGASSRRCGSTGPASRTAIAASAPPS